MLKKLMYILLLFAAAGLMPFFSVWAAQNTVRSTPQSTYRQTGVSNVNAITQAVVKAGILSCASRINQVVNFLAGGVQNVGTMLFMTPNNPDQQLISLSMEVPVNNVPGYASASFAPNQSNGCGAVYETVVYWPQQCNVLAERNFRSLKRVDAFSKDITALDGGAYTKIFLMSAGSGCVSIKKEIVH